uniref:Uncharacterized protein n=1 Tax=Lepeophtheirus salmonis TaxID=72036 RepID=A0A0K2U2T7_LEPSM
MQICSSLHPLFISNYKYFNS